MMLSEDNEQLHIEMHRAVDELGKYVIVLRVTSNTGVNKDEVTRFMNQIMKRSVQECMRNGADLVGHVKSFLSCPEGNLMGSIVEADQEEVAIKDSLPVQSINGFEFTMHVIVHGIWDDKVRDLTRSILNEVFDDYDMSFEIVEDYYDTEKGVAHHGGG